MVAYPITIKVLNLSEQTQIIALNKTFIDTETSPVHEILSQGKQQQVQIEKKGKK